MLSQLKNPVAIIQARMGSNRLPGKVLRPIMGKPILAHIVDRLRAIPLLKQVVIATSDLPGDAPIRAFCEGNRVACFAGSESDVLDRFYRAARQFAADPVIRITGDCPCVDPDVVSALLSLYTSGDYEHVGVAAGAGAKSLDVNRYPDGIDAECIQFAALERAWREAVEPYDREHVTPYLWRVPGRFRIGTLTSPEDYSGLRLTVDTEKDFQVVQAIYHALDRPGKSFRLPDIVAFLRSHPEVAWLNHDPQCVER